MEIYEFIWKISLSLMLGGGICLLIFQAIFDKGDRYTSPEFEKRWQEIVFWCLAGITMTPFIYILIFIIMLVFKIIWR